MKVRYNSQRYCIDFSVPISDPEILDKLAFTLSLEGMREGEISSADTFNDGKQEVISVEFEFPGFKAFDGAKYHCQQNLKDGNIAPHYRGALNHIDPQRIGAAKLRDRALSAK